MDPVYLQLPAWLRKVFTPSIGFKDIDNIVTEEQLDNFLNRCALCMLCVLVMHSSNGSCCSLSEDDLDAMMEETNTAAKAWKDEFDEEESFRVNRIRPAQNVYKVFTPEVWEGEPVMVSPRWHAFLLYMGVLGLQFTIEYVNPADTQLPLPCIDYQGKPHTSPEQLMESLLFDFPLWEIEHGNRSLNVINSLLPAYHKAIMTDFSDDAMAEVYMHWGELERIVTEFRFDTSSDDEVPLEVLLEYERMTSPDDGDDDDLEPEGPQFECYFLEGADISLADMVLAAHTARFFQARRNAFLLEIL
jgi:hypothetical protein